MARCRRGSAAAAGSLMFLAPNRLRGHVVDWVYRAGLPRKVLRAALARAWEHDHDWTEHTAGSPEVLLSWFMTAAFPLPRRLPDPLTIWRGTSGVPFETAVDGISWTTRREVACFFATIYRHRGDPLVIRRTVPLRYVLHYSDTRREAECVVLAGAADAVIDDGGPDKWRRPGAAGTAAGALTTGE
jgi:hypothetical protein